MLPLDGTVAYSVSEPLLGAGFDFGVLPAGSRQHIERPLIREIRPATKPAFEAFLTKRRRVKLNQS